MARVSLIERMTFQQTFEGDEGAMWLYGESIPGGRNKQNQRRNLLGMLEEKQGGFFS